MSQNNETSTSSGLQVVEIQDPKADSEMRSRLLGCCSTYADDTQRTMTTTPWQNRRRRAFERPISPKSRQSRASPVALRYSEQSMTSGCFNYWRDLHRRPGDELCPANGLSLSCTARAHVPKPTRHGGCRGARAKTQTANCNRRDATHSCMLTSRLGRRAGGGP